MKGRHQKNWMKFAKKQLGRALSRSAYAMNREVLFHGARVTFAGDGLVTSHHFGGGTPTFQEALRRSRLEFGHHHNLYHQWRLYMAGSAA